MESLRQHRPHSVTRVFIDGSEGTTGLLISERLAERTDIVLISIDLDHRKDPAARADCLNAADVVFLCLPDEAARESVTLIKNSNTVVIDASTAHRVEPAWAYGLPELGPGYRERLKTSRRIANVGCHAAAFLLGVRPLVEAGLIPRDFPLSAFSITGHSGGGKKMIATSAADPEWLRSPRPYALDLDHKHLPEMRVHAGLARPPVFTPIVASFYQGLAVTVPLSLAALPGRPGQAALHDALRQAYASEPFIRVLPINDRAARPGGLFDVEACNGTNRADVFVFGSGEQAAIVVRLDNLGKGASGAAIQSMNLRLGLVETTGLVT